jgi:tetratricopeptide (TPR) repeat protein
MTELWAKTYKECFDFEGVAAFAEHLRENSLADGLLQENIRLQHQHTQIAYGDKEAEKQSTQLNKHLRDTFSVARLSEREIWLLKQWAVLPATPHKVKDFLLWIGDNARIHKESLKNLLKKGWLHTKDHIAYYMHPTLHMVLRQNLKPTYKDCKKLYNYLFEALDSKKVAANPVAYEWLLPIGEALLQHVDYTNHLEKQAFISYCLCFLYNELGDSSKALPYAEEMVRICKELGGELSEVYIFALNNLANVYLDMKDYESALPLYLEAIEKQEKIAGNEDKDYLGYLHNLALFYFGQKEYEKALLLCQEVLEKRKEILGVQHPDYLVSLNSLAFLYDNMGELTKALSLYQEVLEKWKENLGTQHPHYAIFLYNLGLLYHRQDTLKEALLYFEEAYNIFCNTLGEEHPNTKKAKEALDITKAGLGIQ